MTTIIHWRRLRRSVCVGDWPWERRRCKPRPCRRDHSVPGSCGGRCPSAITPVTQKKTHTLQSSKKVMVFYKFCQYSTCTVRGRKTKVNINKLSRMKWEEWHSYIFVVCLFNLFSILLLLLFFFLRFSLYCQLFLTARGILHYERKHTGKKKRKHKSL